MCGIAGVINYKNIDLNKIANALYHRGPDKQTVYTHDNVGLIHTRLAIQDIQNGTQPFHHENYSIVFNGEIYNHQNLRSLLPEFVFKTSSDTETLLYLFIKFGLKTFDYVDGMYAFCIYDKNKNILTFARDRAGKKPLYYTICNNVFVFASEINAVKAVVPLNVDDDSIHTYLRVGMMISPHTPYTNLQELEAGTVMTVSTDSLDIKKVKYFDILEHYTSHEFKDFDKNQALIELDKRLTQSVSDRLDASDVEVGVFLSGGIDSNLIAAIAAQKKKNLKTFTVKFTDGYDESILAKLTAEKYATQHTELTISPNLKDDIEKILLQYGEPFMDSSAVPSYYVSREAAKHVKVVLGGDGADELFAGYRRYVPAKHRMHHYMSLLSPLTNVLPKAKNKQSLYNYIYRLLTMSKKKGIEYYLSSTTDIFEDIFKIQPNVYFDSLSEFINNTFKNKKISMLNKMLYADFSIILFCDLLVKMDIASMAHSLEVRSPFLSKHMLEFAPSLPDHLKINKFTTKYLLRELAKKYLPDQLIHQPKRGFEVPLKKWVNEDLKDNINSHLSNGCYVEKYIPAKNIQDLVNRKISVAEDKRAKMIWSLYCLEVWLKNDSKNRIYC